MSVLAGVLAAAAPAPVGPRTVVWAMLGQSNMVGRASYDSLGGHPAGVLQWGRGGATDGTLVAAGRPLQHHDPNGGQMGLDIAFADAWVAANPGDTLVFMPGAEGGTGFSDTRWRVGDDLYLDAVSRLNALLAANPGFVLGGFCWHQGEKDGGQTAAFYEGHLDAMIAGLRADVAVAGPATPFVLGQMVPAYHTSSTSRAAIQAVIDDTPNRIPYTAVASSAGLTDKGDGIHFDAASLRTLGARYHSGAVSAALNGGSESAPAAAPAQVTGLGATAGDAQVVLAWTAPADGGSAITDYTIERQVGGGAFAVLADGVGTATGYTDAGLTNGAVHGYRVSAVNAAGTGPASTVVEATPQAAGAGGPVQILAVDSGEDLANLAAYTFAGLAVAPGVAVVAVTHRGSGENVTGVSVGGIAGTQVHRVEVGTSQRAELWVVSGLSGTAADVVVTLSAAAGRCGVVVWSLGDTADAGTVAGVSDMATTSSTGRAVTALAVAGGAVLAHVTGNASGLSGFAWDAPLVGDVPMTAVETSYRHGAASALTASGGSLALGVAFEGATPANSALVVAVVAPATA